MNYVILDKKSNNLWILSGIGCVYMFVVLYFLFFFICKKFEFVLIVVFVFFVVLFIYYVCLDCIWIGMEAVKSLSSVFVEYESMIVVIECE